MAAATSRVLRVALSFNIILLLTGWSVRCGVSPPGQGPPAAAFREAIEPARRHRSVSPGGVFATPGNGAALLLQSVTKYSRRCGRGRANQALMQESDSILIVDDDREIRSLLAAYLEKNGYRALTAGDGREMRACLDRHRVDLVVLDLMLPGEDGLDLCRDLRARTSLPVVMLTARGEETDRIVGLEIGADDYVPKPFNPRELLARIRAVLRRSR